MSTLHVVEDRVDDVGLARLVTGLADRESGRTVVHPTPGQRSSVELAADVLVALGKRFDALQFERATSRSWQVARTWLQAEGVRHLFVLRASSLDESSIARLVDATRRCQTELWLIGADLRPYSMARRWRQRTFTERWAEVGPTMAVTGNGHFPEVPDADFLTFRAACRRALSSGDFELIDRVFCAGMDETTAWLAPQEGRWLTKDDVAAQLHGILVESTCAAEALTRMRAAQAAYFVAGWWIPFAHHGSAPGGLVPLGPTLDPAAANRLRRLCAPTSAALMALVVATDLRGEGLAALNLGDLADRGPITVRSGPASYTIPAYAGSLVRALLVERRDARSKDSDPLFVLRSTSGRFTAKQLTSLLRRLTKATAIAAGLEGGLHHWEDWMTRRRLDLHRLAPELVFAG